MNTTVGTTVLLDTLVCRMCAAVCNVVVLFGSIVDARCRPTHLTAALVAGMPLQVATSYMNSGFASVVELK